MADEKKVEKPKMVEYVTYRDRYVRGEYVRGSPEAPAVILLPEGCPESPLLKRKKPDEVKPEPQKLQPHFAGGATGTLQPAHTRDVAGGRPSDKEPAK